MLQLINKCHLRLIWKDCDTTFMERFEPLPLYARKIMDVEYAIIHAMAKRTLSDVSDSYKYLSMYEIFYKRTSEGEDLVLNIANNIIVLLDYYNNHSQFMLRKIY